MANLQRAVVAPEAPGGTDSRTRERGPGWLAGAVSRAPAAITDGFVVAFAIWTVLYHAAFLFNLAPSVTFRIWLVACLLAVAGVLVRAVRRRPAVRADGDRAPGDAAAARADVGARSDGTDAGPVAAARRRRLVVGGVTVALLAAVLAGLRRPWMPWLPWWVVVLVAAVAALAAVAVMLRTGPVEPGRARPGRTRPWESAYALVLATAVGISSLFFARNTPDDVYYVGKSVWVAERDFVPVRDFLFTQNTGAASAAEPPIPSIEVFAGALGRTLGIHAASALWYLMLPVLAAVSALALWRLVHRWSPRRAVLAFTVALAYLYLVVGNDAALGTFWLPRMHEGKGVFVSAAVPLAWLYLTKWFDTRSRRSLALIVALSITAIGLSTTAAIILPVLAAAAFFGMALVRRWRDGLVGAAALVAYPIAAVIVARVLLGPLGDTSGTRTFDAPTTYGRTLLFGLLGVIGGIALWCGPYLVRRGTPALLMTGATVATTVILVPGVIELLNATTGLAVVLWRLPWILPLPALIGMISAIDPPGLRLPAGAPLRRGLVGAVAAAALVAVFAVDGTPLWSPTSFVEAHGQPTWKLPQQRQRLAFWMKRLDRSQGLLLAPSVLMRAMPIVTSRVPVVNARDYYLSEYGATSQFVTDRVHLSAFADGRPTVPVAELKAEMDRLHVAVVCVYKGNKRAIAAAPALGLEEFARHGKPGAMVCFRPAAGTGG